MNSLSNFSSIGRPVDLNYPTNRAIALLTVGLMIGSALFRLLTGDELLQGILGGIGAGLTIFLAWAVSREVDPDHDLSAFWGAGLALVGLLLAGLPSFGALLWLLLILRVVNRTSGREAKIGDSVAILGLGGWLAWYGNWLYGLLTALAFLLDSRLSAPTRRHLPFAGAAFVIAVISFGFGETGPRDSSLSLASALAIVIISILFTPVIIASRQVEAVGDQTGEPLNPRRVRLGQFLALLAGVLIALGQGNAGVVALLPLWAALLGVVLYALGGLVLKYRKNHFTNLF
jgi:hypothetical protein